MKLKYIIILYFCLLLTGCGYAKNQEPEPSKEATTLDENALSDVSPETEENAPETLQINTDENTKSEDYSILFEVDSAMDREYNYDSLKDLQRDSTDTFLGKVISAEAKIPGSLVYTKYEMEITEVFSGDLAVGDKINVAVLGGIVKADEYFAEANMSKSYENEYTPELLENSHIKITYDGAWLMESGEEYLLFTQYISYDGDMVYSPLNTWQGIFKENNNLYERYESETYQTYQTTLQFNPEDIKEKSK